MDEFEVKPNSHAYRTKQKETAEERKKVEKVVSGSVKTKKKSGVGKVAGLFISDDVKDVKEYAVKDVLVPTIKKVIVDLVSDGINIIVNGKGAARRDSKVGYRSYSSYSRDDRRAVSSVSSRFDYDDLVFTSRGDAEIVCDQLDEMIDRYGFATVADFYDAAGKSAPYTAQKYGWTSIRNADIIRLRDGDYIIKLPKAMPLD